MDSGDFINKKALAQIGIIQHNNGFLVTQPEQDYGRALLPGWIFHDFESAIAKAKEDVERQLRTYFGVPAPAPVLVDFTMKPGDPVPVKSAMKFADGRTHIITEGIPSAE